MRDTTAEPDEPGLVASSVTMVRLIGAWACIGVALLDLAMGVDPTDWPYLMFHAMLLVSGLALLVVGPLRRRPGRIAWIAGAVVTVVGLVVSGLVRRGFPFTLPAHGFDAGRAIADLIFWCGVGLIALLLVKPLRRTRPTVAEVPARPHATHAEDRTPAPRDENVGGLP